MNLRTAAVPELIAEYRRASREARRTIGGDASARREAIRGVAIMLNVWNELRARDLGSLAVALDDWHQVLPQLMRAAAAEHADECVRLAQKLARADRVIRVHAHG